MSIKQGLTELPFREENDLERRKAMVRKANGR
jgi:hypothetical protein